MNELRELTAIVEEINGAASFGDAAEALTRWARAFTRCESAILRLWQPEAEATWLMACVADGAGEAFARDETVIHGRECICGRVAAGDVDLSLPFYTEAGSFHWGKMGGLLKEFHPEQLGLLRGRCMKESFESLAVVPVRSRNNLVGALHLADRRPDRFAGSLEVLEAVCRLAGDTLLRHKTREREQAVLAAVEMALLPTVPPKVEGLEIGVCFTSATEMAHVGGDFYDVLDLGDSGALILVGDVSGKGVEAAGFAARARYVIEEQANRAPDPASFLQAANDSLTRALPAERFVTAAACLIDRRSGLATVCLAGHPSPMVLTPEKGGEILAPHNPPLGVMTGLRYEQAHVRLSREDTLLVCTDGIADARRGAVLFGAEGILEVAGSQSGRDPASIAHAVCSAAAEFHDADHPGDDRLAIAVRLRGSRRSGGT